MRTIIIAAMLAMSLTAFTQDKKKEVADQTTVSDLKTNVKFDTESDAVFKQIMAKFESQLIRYIVTYKKDRQGRYKQYSLYFAPEIKEQVIASIK